MGALADRWVAYAFRHPHFDLTRPTGEVYMKRWWFLGHGTERDRDPNGVMCNPAVGKFRRGLSKRFIVRLHQILLSDRDRHMHDHPSWSISIVVRGGYWELIPDENGSKFPFDAQFGDGSWWKLSIREGDEYCAERCRAIWRAPGHIVFRRARSRHKILIPRNQCAWSIFCLGRSRNAWGFYVGDVKVPWRDYESQHGNP